MKHRSVLFGLALLLGAVLMPTPAAAQPAPQDDLSDLGNALQTISEGYADNYVQPITNTFGAGVGAGLFRSADVGNSLIPGFPLNVYLGVSVSGALTSSMETSFRPFGGGTESFTDADGRSFTVDYEPNGDERVPTVLGETDPPSGQLRITDDQTGFSETVQAPQGLVDTPIAPLIIPQLGVGSAFGTDVQLRYFPKSKLSFAGSSYGTVGVFGLAVRHDLDQWFPAPLPLNLAIQGAWNQFSLENDIANSGTKEVLDASGWAINLQASKGLPVAPITFYGGLQYEKFNVDYDYAYDPGGSIPAQKFSIGQTASSSVRGLAGVTFTAAVVRINVDYAVTNGANVVTTGLGVRL
jgi:hypothetical protein